MRVTGEEGGEGEEGIGGGALIRVAMTGMQASRGDILAEMLGEGNLKGGGRNSREATPHSGGSLPHNSALI